MWNLFLVSLFPRDILIFYYVDDTIHYDRSYRKALCVLATRAEIVKVS